MPGGWGTPGRVEEPEPGRTFVWGKTPETAQALLAACEELDVDQVEVAAVNGGFIVPDAVWDHVQEQQTLQPAGIEF